MLPLPDLISGLTNVRTRDTTYYECSHGARLTERNTYVLMTTEANKGVHVMTSHHMVYHTSLDRPVHRSSTATHASPRKSMSTRASPSSVRGDMI
jgi:hypothetical protein